ncbi:hypothetical protein IMZ11_42530, partial [Microtetraspora sp. AC03309]|nr:hypothetical protein [Microtetraspora sp. AC03309]
EAVGIVAAQSIGEPGTQLTMRTFHQGGVTGGADIVGGLPRVQELFEARIPRNKAPIADVAGRVRLEESDKFFKITIVPDDGGEEVVYDKLSKRQRLRVITHEDGSEGVLSDGDHVEVGDQLMEGSADPHEVLRVQGPREVQIHLVKEVQEVYRAQGVSIHDKHIEVIVRQMLRRVTIIDSGATEFLPGSLTERAEFETENRRVVAEGGEPAAGRPVLIEVDLAGARAVKKAMPEAVSVFLAPPSWDELVSRLSGRGTETPEVMARRLETARAEMAAQSDFDQVVVN